MSCPRDAEYFGADFRLGAYLPMFPPARLAKLQDVVLPILPEGRILLDGLGDRVQVLLAQGRLRPSAGDKQARR